MQQEVFFHSNISPFNENHSLQTNTKNAQITGITKNTQQGC